MDLQPSENQEQEKVSLYCRADNYTYESLQWYRLDPRALRDEHGEPRELDCRSMHLYAETLDSQLSFQESSNSWVLNFTVPSLQLQDEGHYVCEAQRRRSGEKQCLFRYIAVKGETRKSWTRQGGVTAGGQAEDTGEGADDEGHVIPERCPCIFLLTHTHPAVSSIRMEGVILTCCGSQPPIGPPSV